MPASSFLAIRGLAKSHLFATAAAAVMLSACSADMDRFASNPSDSDPVYTASVPKKQQAAEPSYDGGEDSIASKPLAGAQNPPVYKYQPAPKAPAYKQPTLTAQAPKPAAPQVPQVEMADEAPSVPAGSSVTVGSGMTLYSIARANNLAVSQLAAANNIKPPYAVHQGQVLRIPGTDHASLPEASVKAPVAEAAKIEPVARPKVAAAPFKSTAGETHEVASGDTLFSLGRKYGISPYSIADANGLSHSATLSLGQKVKIPGSSSGKIAALAPKSAASKPKAAAAAEEITAEEEPQAATAGKAAKAEPKLEAIPAPKAESAAPAEQQVAEAPAPSTEDSSSGMRWPVRGKVISNFGAKPNGLKNEGINIAVPEGTSIRAAEGGVVAYAGNELKGYGNLVLVRHDGGYVTAYAHAKELFVKRGDTVKRGDVIAKAGQTGSVSSPQLHFEVRKGATALDPMKFLASATAAN